jgi:hypothetical protein
MNRRILRRHQAIREAAGFPELQSYVRTQLKKTALSAESADEVRQRLILRATHLSIGEVDRLPLVEALAILNQPEAPPEAPPATPCPGATGDTTGASGGAKETADGPSSPDGDDVLGNTDWKNLAAIVELGAHDSPTAVTREEITEKSGTGNHDSTHNKDSFKRLKMHKLIDAKRRIGTWATNSGRSAIKGRADNKG